MRLASVALTLSGLIALVMGAVYLRIISAQGDDGIRNPVVIVVATEIFVASLLTLDAALQPTGHRSVLAAAATALLLVVGFLGIFTIGMPLLVAALLAALGAVRTSATEHRSRMATLAGLLTFVAATALFAAALSQRV